MDYHDHDLFAPSKNMVINPFELNNEGKGQALVLRYAGCNLGPRECPLCYAWRYAWKPKHSSRVRAFDIQKSVDNLKNLSKVASKKIVWIRIQGGEPCINYYRIKHTITFAVHALDIIYQYGLNFFKKIRVIIQTNCIIFAHLSAKKLIDISDHLIKCLEKLERGKIVFEVSFKSPHKRPLLSLQIAGFYKLLNEVVCRSWSYGFDEVSIYPIAGLGPSIDFHNVWLTPVDPYFLPEEVPLFHPETWSKDFRNMLENFLHNIVPNNNAYNDFRNNINTNGGKKVAIEEFEPTLFQTSWISGYAGGYRKYGVHDIPPVDILLRKTSSNPDRQWLALFRRNRRWYAVLNRIPVSKNPCTLKSLIRDMKNVFYPSHPAGHYPFL